jgi:hypothetical protein
MPGALYFIDAFAQSSKNFLQAARRPSNEKEWPLYTMRS